MSTKEFKVFDLDENNLDKEWLEQARIFYEYATQLADARMEYEQAKAKRDLIEAEIDEDIRLNPKDYKVDKVSEARISKVIVASQGYQQATKNIIITKHKVDTLQAMVDALEHRKKALEKRTDLWIHEWYAEPKAPKGAERGVKQMKTDAVLGKRKND